MNSSEFEEQNKTLTFERAIKLVESHLVDASDFINDFGICETYQTSKVLTWLGY